MCLLSHVVAATKCIKKNIGAHRVARWGWFRKVPLLVVLLISITANAYSNDSISFFDIPQQRADSALSALGQQANVSVVFRFDAVSKFHTNTLRGRYTLPRAVGLLLAGTGLSAEMDEGGSLVILEDNNQGNEMNSKKNILAAVIGGVLSGGVGAQDEGGDELGWLLEEVVVTATRRETSLQDTAMAVSAFSGQELSKKSHLSFRDVLTSVPGLSLGSSEPANTRINIRGVQGGDRANNMGAANLTTLNDFPIGEGMANIQLVDIDRVEVLKGPQGTLYGKSSMGGTVRYITNKPETDSQTAGVEALVSSTELGGLNHGLKGHINLPITDSIAMRMVAYDYDYDGFIDINGLDKQRNANTKDIEGVRAALSWEATDTVMVDMMYLYQTLQTGTAQRISSSYTPFESVAGTITPPDVQKPNFSNPTNQYLEPGGIDNEAFMMKISMDFDLFDISVMGMRDKADVKATWDLLEYLLITNGAASVNEEKLTKSNRYEVRLISNPGEDDFFDWILGLWSEDTNSVATRNSSYRAAPGTGAISNGWFVDGDVVSDARRTFTGSERAIYGEVGMKLTDKAKLTLGYRKADVVAPFIFVEYARGLLDSQNLEYIEQQEYAETYKINFEYSLSSDVLLYTLASSGYRAGGVNSGSLTGTGAAPSTFDSDSIWNYELGAKTTWINDRLIVNANLYQIDWDDLQLRLLINDEDLSDGNDTFNGISNINSADIRGFELESKFLLFENLHIGLNFSYIDATINDDDVLTGAKSGDRIPEVPDRTVSLNLDWAYQINNDYKANVYATYRYIGEYENFLGETKGTAINVTNSDYSITDLNISLDHKQSGLQASLFANNLFNKVVGEHTFNINSYFSVQNINTPRTIGLRIGYDF